MGSSTFLSGMKEWEIRRILYHSFYLPDDLGHKHKVTVDSRNIKECVMRHFTEDVEGLIYPAKSYFVSIIYASLLNKYFNEPFDEVLKREDLLVNQTCNVLYWEDPDTYNYVLSKLTNDMILNENISQIAATIDYFKQEFFIGEYADRLDAITSLQPR